MKKQSLLFSFLFLTLILSIIPFSPLQPFVKADSGTFYPAHSSDDAYEIPGVGIYYTQDYVQVYGSGRSGGVRFQTVSIPEGSTINEANVSIYVYSDTTDDPDFILYGHDVADSQNFVDLGVIEGRTKTSASTNVQAVGVGVGWYVVDCTSIIAELIGREDWNVNDPLTLLFIEDSGTNFAFRSFDYGSLYAYLTVDYTPPPSMPIYHDVEPEEGEVLTDSYFWLNSTVELPDGTEALVNVTLGLTHGIILNYDNATDTFSEYADPSSYVTLGDSDKSNINGTFVEVSYNVSFSDNTPMGFKDVLISSTIAFDVDDYNDTYQEVNLFLLLNSSLVLRLEDTVFDWGFSNVSGDQIWKDDLETTEAFLNIYDNSTMITRSLSDYGSTVTNYATLYIIDHGFVWGWSSTIYDVYRNQSYECIGEPGYQDWLYTGLFVPPSVPESFPTEVMPWYVPIIGYLAAVLLPFMIIAYYWNKARDWKTGLMVLFVCIMCYILFLTLWNLSDALMYWLYR